MQRAEQRLPPSKSLNAHEIKILQSSTKKGYPRIRYDLPANRAPDWLTIGEMCRGETAADPDLLSSVELQVNFGKKKADILSFTSALLVSEQAKAVLEPLNFQKRWYRWLVSGKPYFLLLVDSICDILDRNKSDFEYFDDGTYWRVSRIVLREDTAATADIFRIPEIPMVAFCGPAARAAIAAAGLIGFNFIPLEYLHDWARWDDPT